MGDAAVPVTDQKQTPPPVGPDLGKGLGVVCLANGYLLAAICCWGLIHPQSTQRLPSLFCGMVAVAIVALGGRWILDRSGRSRLSQVLTLAGGLTAIGLMFFLAHALAAIGVLAYGGWAIQVQMERTRLRRITTT